MKTITLQIGNSDDKLTQKQWAQFVADISRLLAAYSCKVHFHGGSPFDAVWQNACWVFECPDFCRASLLQAVYHARLVWNQESVAWTEGPTSFV